MKKFTSTIIIAIGSAGLMFAQAPKKVILEDFTGTWCGYCPRGTTVMEDVLTTYPNSIGMALHNQDGLANAYSNAIDAGLDITAYPNGAVDRYKFPDQQKVGMGTSLWKSKVANRLLSSTPVAVSFSSTYNPSTRALSVTVYVNFAGSASGDLRINCVLIEDGITGYPQQNYMGQGCSAPDPSSPWYNYPCVINNFVHNYVARVNLANNHWGTSGVIPSSVTAGSNYSQNYTYTLPSTWNANNVSIVAFVSRYGPSAFDREILNSVKGAIGTTVGIVENTGAPVEIIKTSPNPFRDLTAVQFNLNNKEHVSVKVYNMYGQEINVLADMEMLPGEHTYYWAGDDVNENYVTPGVYYISVITAGNTSTRPVVYMGK